MDRGTEAEPNSKYTLLNSNTKQGLGMFFQSVPRKQSMYASGAV